MTPLQIIVVVLFGAFFVGSWLRIVAMLGHKKAGLPMGRSRLVFFFTASLMLVCLIPLGMFDMLSAPVTVSDLAVVLANLAGFALTYGYSVQGGTTEEEEMQATVRAYQVYYGGKPFGIITKEAFDGLLQHGLLKRQRTIELVDDFKKRAREQGVGISLLRSRDGNQTLVKVEIPEEGEPEEL